MAEDLVLLYGFPVSSETELPWYPKRERALGQGRPVRALRHPVFASSPLGPGRPARALRILAFASSLTVVTLAISPFHQASLEGRRVRGAALGCACHGKPFYSFIRFVSHCMSVRSNKVNDSDENF